MLVFSVIHLYVRAGSQAELSMRNAEAANISAIRKAQADAQADLDYQRSQLTLEYQNAIREAIAKNELQKAQALYDGYGAVDDLIHGLADGRNGRRSSLGKVDIIESDDLDLIRN